MAKAYCYASGEVVISAVHIEGAIAFAKGSKKALENEMAVVCRHAKDNETPLVPGIPEATDQLAGIDALTRFSDWLKKRGNVTVLREGVTYRTGGSTERPGRRGGGVMEYQIEQVAAYQVICPNCQEPQTLGGRKVVSLTTLSSWIGGYSRRQCSQCGVVSDIPVALPASERTDQ